MSSEANVDHKTCPYQGLVPYSEEDADYFFGRKKDTGIIVANCLTTRVTLLYGASGVGKSSVLYAGVTRELRNRAAENIRALGCPESLIVCFSSWRDNPVSALQKRIDASLLALFPETRFGKRAPQPGLSDTVRGWTTALNSDLVLVLDQFEEYFLYRPAHDTSFGDELVLLLNDRSLRVNILISLREDAIARLDSFKTSIPALFDNSLRLEHLREEAARSATTDPLSLFNERERKGRDPIVIEPLLVEAILDQVRAGRVRLRDRGEGEIKAGTDDGLDAVRVEAPYLQIVLMRLWREDIDRAGGRALTLATFKRLGGAQEIVRTHLDEVMNQLSPNQRCLAARLFHQLVTPGGTKIAHFTSDLVQYVGASQEAIESVFAKLERPDTRVLRDVTPPGSISKRYEIFHDLLAAPVLDWRRRELGTERRVRLLRWGGAVLVVITAILISGVYASYKKYKADLALAEAAAKQNEDEAEFNKLLVVEARKEKTEHVDVVQQAADDVRKKEEKFSDVPVSPTAGVVDTTPPPTEDSDGPEFETKKLFVHKSAVWTARYSPTVTLDGKQTTFLITASRDQTAGAWDLRRDDDFFLRGHKGEVNDAWFNPKPSPDGSGWLAATASDDKTAALWRWSGGAAPTFLKGHREPVTGLAWSADGKWLVTTSKDKEVRIWDLSAADQPKTARILRGHTASVWLPVLVETNKGSWLVTPSDDESARIWTFPDGKPARFASGYDENPGVLMHGSPVRRVAMDSQGRWVVTAGAAGHAILWDRNTGERLCMVHHEKPVRDVAFKHDSSLFVTAAADNTAQVWDAARRQGVVTLRGHTAPVFSARFTPYGPGVVTVSWDKTARLWNYETKKCVAVLRGHVDVLWSVEFSPSGTNFTTTSGDGTARLWDLKSIPGGEAFLPPPSAK